VSFEDYQGRALPKRAGRVVAEIPSIPGCYALMRTTGEALAELQQVFDLIASEYRDKGLTLPTDTTQIVHA
jgi:predicted RNase H-like HicB family nuclease